MIHAFLLLLYLGTGETRALKSGDMYFRDINDCLYFANRLAKRYGNYKYYDYMDPRDRATTYCVPAYIDSTKVRVY